MLRQVGLAIGVCVFIAVVGAPRTQEAALTAWQQGWTVIALIGALAAVVGAVGLRRRATVADSAATPAITAALTTD